MAVTTDDDSPALQSLIADMRAVADNYDTISKVAPKLNIAITPIDDNFAKLQAGDIVYPDFPTGGFDVTRRLKDMDDTDVDVQVPTAARDGELAARRPGPGHRGRAGRPRNGAAHGG